jgi:hypothetical protein
MLAATEDRKMQIYMGTFQGADTTSGPVEVDLGSPFQVGDLVLGVVLIVDAGNGNIGVSDVKSDFAGSISAATAPGYTVALIQNLNNHSGKSMFALMQRGTTVPLSGSIDINLQT